jgi:hypothetical protein
MSFINTAPVGVAAPLLAPLGMLSSVKHFASRTITHLHY